MNAKVSGNLAALAYLVTQFVERAQHLPIVAGAKAIMPMPSSLWGRYKGRIDIAHHLAFHFAKAKGVRFVKPPWALGWHTKKRAMINASQKTKGMVSKKGVATAANEKFILVVDDLCTTGSSYNALKAKLSGEETKLLTFAGMPMGPSS